MDGHVRVAGDVGHTDSAQPGFVDLEPPPSPCELLDGDPALHAGERGPEAAVHTMAEPDADARLPFDVELVGALERPGITRRCPRDEEHGEAGWDRPAPELALLHAEPALVLRWRPVPEDLLDRTRDPLAVVDHLLPLVRMPPEQDHRVADELCHRLGARPAEQRGEAGDLGVVEPRLRAVAAVDGDLPVLGARRHLARFATKAGVDSVTDLLTVSLWDAEHARDDLDREGRGEVGDGVELACVVERVEEAADDFPDHRFQRSDRPWCEHAAHERSEAIVLGGIHHDDVPIAGDLLRVLGEGEELDAVRAREPLPVAVRGQDVGKARQRIEAVLLAAIHRRLVAKTPVQRVGVVEELLRERIELDWFRCDGHECSLTSGRGATVTDGIDRLAPPRSTASTTETSSST